MFSLRGKQMNLDVHSQKLQWWRQGRCLSSRRLRSYSFRYTDVILPYDVSKRDAKDSRKGQTWNLFWMRNLSSTNLPKVLKSLSLRDSVGRGKQYLEGSCTFCKSICHIAFEHGAGRFHPYQRHASPKIQPEVGALNIWSCHIVRIPS